MDYESITHLLLTISVQEVGRNVVAINYIHPRSFVKPEKTLTVTLIHAILSPLLLSDRAGPDMGDGVAWLFMLPDAASVFQ